MGIFAHSHALHVYSHAGKPAPSRAWLKERGVRRARSKEEEKEEGLLLPLVVGRCWGAACAPSSVG